MRVILWLAIAMALLWVFRRRKAARGLSAPHRRAAHGEPEAMVQCRQCLIYLPASEALADASGSLFCCDDHRSRQRAN